MKHLGDITKINGAEIEPVDVVIGGSPCQGLSHAGRRLGLADERSGLFMEQIRVIKELRKADENSGRTGQFIRPRFMVWENVPGAFSTGDTKGADFAAVLEETVKVVEPNIPQLSVSQDGWKRNGCLYDELGRWSIAWTVHDAQNWCVPQRRQRISLVADFGGMCAPEILFERKGLSRDSEPCGETGEGTADPFERCPSAADSYILQIRGGVDVDSKGKRAGKGALIQVDRCASLTATQDKTLFQAVSV